MRALILAAGRGERMRPFSDMLPKPMLEVGGKALIAWQVERLRDAGFEQILINTAWLGQSLHAALGDGSALGVCIDWQDEPPGAWETGGGIATALPRLGGEPFVVVSGDIYTDFDYSRLLQPARAIANNPHQTCAHFVLVDNPAHHPGGDMALDAAGRVQRSGTLLNYGNIGVFHPRMFAGQDAATRWKLFPWAYRFVEQGQVSGEHFRGRWENVGTPEQWHALDDQLKR